MTLNVFFTNSFDSQKFTTNDIVMMVLAWILDNTFIDKLKYDRQIHLPLAEFSKLNLKNLSPKLGEKFALFINWTHGLKGAWSISLESLVLKPPAKITTCIPYISMKL